MVLCSVFVFSWGGFWVKIFSDQPSPTSLGVRCYCREPLRKSQSDILVSQLLLRILAVTVATVI